MNRRTSSVASRLLARRAADLKRHVPDAVNGDAHGVHQARVASRRLREAVPVLTAGVKGTKARKVRGKIRRLTQALGTVRELDVTIQLLDELVANETLPRPALEAVRGRVVTERDARRAVDAQAIRTGQHAEARAPPRGGGRRACDRPRPSHGVTRSVRGC